MESAKTMTSDEAIRLTLRAHNIAMLLLDYSDHPDWKFFVSSLDNAANRLNGLAVKLDPERPGNERTAT